MNSVIRLIVLLFLLSGMAALAYSQAPVKLDGSEGMALLKSLTKGPMDVDNTSLNNSSLNTKRKTVHESLSSS